MACQKEPCGMVSSAIRYVTIALGLIGAWLSWESITRMSETDEMEERLIIIEERQKYLIERGKEIIDKIKEMDKERHDERIKNNRSSNSSELYSNELCKSINGKEGR